MDESVHFPELMDWGSEGRVNVAIDGVKAPRNWSVAPSPPTMSYRREEVNKAAGLKNQKASKTHPRDDPADELDHSVSYTAEAV